jgi:acetylornithine aminotransferase
MQILRDHLTRHPGRHAAMWFEFVQGEGGYNAGSGSFFRALMEELRKAKIAVVADEIQTFGRTSRPFAFEHFELGEFVDVVTVGKMLQACATLFTDAYRPGPGLLSQTFTASTSAIRAARAILHDLTLGTYFGADGRNMLVHRRIVERFTATAARHPSWIRGPFGLGGMIAFQVLDGTEAQTKTFLRQLFDAGVIAFYCGDAPVRVRFLPPIGAVTDEQIDRVCEILVTTLAAAVKGGPDGGHSTGATGGS